MTVQEINGKVKDMKRWFKNHFTTAEYKIIAQSPYKLSGYGPKGYYLIQENSFNKFEIPTKEGVMELVTK